MCSAKVHEPGQMAQCTANPLNPFERRSPTASVGKSDEAMRCDEIHHHLLAWLLASIPLTPAPRAFFFLLFESKVSEGSGWATDYVGKGQEKRRSSQESTDSRRTRVLSASRLDSPCPPYTRTTSTFFPSIHTDRCVHAPPRLTKYVCVNKGKV